MKINLKYLFSAALSIAVTVNAVSVSALPVFSFGVDSAEEEVLPIQESVESATLSSSQDIYSFAPEFEFTVERAYDSESNPEPSDKPEVSLLAGMTPFEGNGTQNNPYLIGTKTDLNNFRICVASTYEGNDHYRYAYYQLTDNIDYGADEWVPVGSAETPFSGVFNGNGYTVSNFKITRAESSNNKFYLGFFGFIKNGSVTELNLSDINIDVNEFITINDENHQINNISEGNNVYVHVGILAGCIDSTGNVRNFIENCNISDSSVSISGNFRIYGGGLAGFIDSSEGSEVTISGCSAEARLNYIVNDTSRQIDEELKDELNRSRIRSGGLIGYIGISGLVNNSNNTVDYVPTKVNIENCSTRADNITTFYDINADSRNNTHSGGLIGSVGMEYKGTLNVSESYSSNMVYSYGDSDVYTGAFIGYTTSTDSAVIINDSFSNARVYAQCKAGESYTSGFVAIDIVNPGNPGTYSYADCYSASDIIIDVKDNEKDSVSATFLAFNNGGHTLTNCYSVDGLVHSYGSAILGTYVETVVSKEDAVMLNTFNFDESIWKVSSGSYTYPTLINTEYKTATYAIYEFVSKKSPVLIQSDLSFGSSFVLPDSTPESLYIFSHWSVSPSGVAVGQTDTVTGSYILFPNFSNDYVSFEISFSANGQVFEKNEQKYNSTVVFPTPEEKPSDSLFSYEFSHWSLSENGPELTDDEIIVKGECTYYAVYFQTPNNGWDGSSYASFTKGNGTKDAPYEITDGFQLYYLSKMVNEGVSGYADAYYTITRSIDLSGNEWTPIGTAENPFSGNLNGNGYSIFNFKFHNPSTRYVGLFGYLDSAVISKLEINGVSYEFETNSFVSSTENSIFIGGLAGYVCSSTIGGSSSIKECAVTGTTLNINEVAESANSAVYAGAIAGCVYDYPGYVYIENCFSNASMRIGGYDYTTPNTNIVYCGGIVGNFVSQSSYVSCINKSYFSGQIAVVAKTAGYAGGIVAFVRNSSDYVGGLQSSGSLYAESTTGDVKNCFSAAESISVNRNAIESYAGVVYGFIANASMTKVSNCAASPDVIVSAHDIVSTSGFIVPSSTDDFKAASYLTETLGFNFDDIWKEETDAFPTLKAFNQPESYFKLFKFNLDSEKGILSVTISSRYREVTDYIVLAGVYNERGKMIGFKTLTVTDATNAQTTEFEIENVHDADKCKLSIVLPGTFELLEHTKEI